MIALAFPSTAAGRRWLASLCAMTAMALSSSARAEGPATDFCRKTTARAESDAALLFAPTLHAHMIRFPSSGFSDPTGTVIGRGFQPRAGVSVGLVDIYKGFGVLDVARADCRRQESVLPLEQIVAQRADIGRLPALERKLAFLRDRSASVEEIVRLAEERFAAQSSTLSEVEDIRLHALAFKRRIADTEREIAIVKSRGVPTPVRSLAETLRDYEGRSIELDEKIAHVRKLQPWRVDVSGGVAATPSAEVYGVAEISYNLGGLFQGSAERRAIEARASELKNARYELRQQLETITRELRASAAETRRQAQLIEVELSRMARDLASLADTEAPNKHGVVAAITLAMIDLEAEHTFLTALADNQAAFGAVK